MLDADLYSVLAAALNLAAALIRLATLHRARRSRAHAGTRAGHDAPHRTLPRDLRRAVGDQSRLAAAGWIGQCVAIRSRGPGRRDRARPGGRASLWRLAGNEADCRRGGGPAMSW